MSLHIDKMIAIEAPMLKVWEVLTDSGFTDQWLRELSGNRPAMHIESNWRLGSAVTWKDEQRKIIMNGKVTVCKAPERLCFTVVDPKKDTALNGHSILFELSEHGGSKTFLRVLEGNFSNMQDGKKRHHASVMAWDRVLPKIKALAEAG